MPALPSRFDTSEYILPPPTVALGKSFDAHERSRSAQLDRLAVLADSIAKNRAKLNGLNDRLEALFREAERTEATSDELETAASAILNAERTAAESLLPQIEQLEQSLARKYPPTAFAKSLRHSAEEALDIGQTWLELYQNLRIRLLKLASDRRVAAGETGGPILSDAGEMEEYLRRITRE